MFYFFWWKWIKFYSGIKFNEIGESIKEEKGSGNLLNNLVGWVIIREIDGVENVFFYV